MTAQARICLPPEPGFLSRRLPIRNKGLPHACIGKTFVFKEALINARFFHLLLKGMRTYLLLRGRSRRGLPVAAPGGDREAVEEVWKGGG